MNQIPIFNNKADYSPEQLVTIQQLGTQLMVCEQGQVRDLEETRIMVAARRLQLEDNFRIVLEKAPKEVKERKAKKLIKKNFLLLASKLEDGVEISPDELADFKHSLQFWDKDNQLDLILLGII
jgi:hypothetical protein